MNKPYVLYILICGNSSFYTSITTNLVQRLASHQLVADYPSNNRQWTKFHQPVELAFKYDGIENLSVASKLERYVKSLSKDYKQLLVDGDHASLDFLKRKHMHFSNQSPGTYTTNQKPSISNMS